MSLSNLSIVPPLVNSSNPWATSLSDLRELYQCQFTGAVTTRTSLLKGFSQDPNTHQYTFFSTILGHATAEIDISGAEGRGQVEDGETTSLNTLGYSPTPFKQYVAMIVRMSQNGELNRTTVKPFIISVTGTAEEVGECYAHLIEVATKPDELYPHPDGKISRGLKLMMEINLSCPNIPDKPPPAYDGTSLLEYTNSIAKVLECRDQSGPQILVGIKTPPYTYSAQFKTLMSAFEQSATHSGGCPVSFITATNTLGNCYVVNAEGNAALGSVNGSGIGGIAGDALHALALGNVKSLRELLDNSEHSSVRSITIIGVGGVKDRFGFRRMKCVGAEVVGVGTAFGRQGVAVFEEILHEYKEI